MKKVLVLLNPESGALAGSFAGDEAERILRVLTGVGIDGEVRRLDAEAMARVIEAVKATGDYNFDAILAGGGDGTINVVANALAGGAIPMGVLPLGTHNHFAKDLNVPLLLEDAVAALGDALNNGGVDDVDVAEVNGRIFLNFSGIGLHPTVVAEREAARETLGVQPAWGRFWSKAAKLLAGLIAFCKTLGHLPVLRVTLTGDGKPLRRLTPSVIVCNNPHQMRLFGVEAVSHAHRSMLNIYVAKATGPVGVVRLLIAAMLRRLDTANARDFEAHRLTELSIGLRRRRLAVSIDGEVVDMTPPLRYRILRGKLKVLAPRG
jgi:diacylglycerol kinase family enzyme